MRSSILLASALAMGAIAGPINKRAMVTEVDLEVVTVTVFVTPGQAVPTQEGDAYQEGHGHSRYSKSKSKAAASSSSTPAPAPSLPAPEPSSVYTPPPAYSTPTPSPEPTSAPAPSSSPANTPEPSTPASSSQAPASSAPAYGQHQSGEIQATFSSGEDYEAAVLWHHNRARANHGAEALVWNSTCEEAARTAAQNCDFEHHIVDGQGQNLFTVSGDLFNVTGGITDSWYKAEADKYQSFWGQNPDTSTFHDWGHLTQMVWKSTTSVGCVSIDCGSKMTINGQSSQLSKYTVCNYSPPGNYEGMYAENVVAPQGDYHSFLWSD